MGTVRAFRDLRVYGAAVELRQRVFGVSKGWPKAERYALTDQIRRSSRSVGANIAEAWSKRRYPRHFVAKLTDAHGEAEETSVWLDTALECGYLTNEAHDDLMALVRAAAGGLATMVRQSEAWANPSEGAVRDPSIPYVTGYDIHPDADE